MKFLCEQSIINEALNNVSRATSTKSPITALEGVKFSLNQNSLELIGYDLELGIKTKIEVKSEDVGEIVVNAVLLCDIIRKMPKGELSFESENFQMLIKGENAEYKIMTLDVSEYPALPETAEESSDDTNTLKIPQSLLKNMINQTIYAVAVKDSKPILTGELFDIEDNIFNLVAIDGFRLAIRKENIENPNKFNFVVKAKALLEVSKLLRDSKETEEVSEVTLHITKKHVVFDIDGYMVISRLLEGEFHNYKGSLPTSCQTEVVISTKEVINCLERCMLLISEKTTGPARLFFKDGKVKISCSTSLGKFNDEIIAEINGPSVEMGFNCRYLLEAVKATETDKVKMQLNSGVSPMKILPLDGDDFIFLVLPVRLKDY